MKKPKDIRDETLEAVLRDLPRARAGEGFTERLMARLDTVESGALGQVAPLGWLVPAAAVMLCAFALSFIVIHSQGEKRTSAEQAEIRRLLEQHQQLEEELAAVRRAVREAEPVLYLEGLPTQGGHSVDLVVEMPANVRPASYRLD